MFFNYYFQLHCLFIADGIIADMLSLPTKSDNSTNPHQPTSGAGNIPSAELLSVTQLLKAQKSAQGGKVATLTSSEKKIGVWNQFCEEAKLCVMHTGMVNRHRPGQKVYFGGVILITWFFRETIQHQNIFQCKANNGSIIYLLLYRKQKSAS